MEPVGKAREPQFRATLFRLDKRRAIRTGLGFLIVLLLGAVGWLDFRTGPWLSLGLLYVTPVMAAAWWLGRGPALAAALAASSFWFMAEAGTSHGEPMFDLAWNGSSRLVMLLAMGAMLVRIRRDRLALQRANFQLERLLGQEEQLARTDALTGLANRRAFLERLGDELARTRRTRGALCLGYLDVDNFKSLNDQHGHGIGDEFLKLVAQAIRDTVRASDVPARLGGDEFAVLFVDAHRDAMELMAERLVASVKVLAAKHPELQLGASVGMAYFPTVPDLPEELLRRADAAMYAAKSQGKGRFALWTPDPAIAG